jgi:hypothetical protein
MLTRARPKQASDGFFLWLRTLTFELDQKQTTTAEAAEYAELLGTVVELLSTLPLSTIY